MNDKSKQNKPLDTDGYACKPRHKPFRGVRMSRPHEAYVLESPHMGECETVDSSELLVGTATPQVQKKKGFFARIFRK